MSISKKVELVPSTLTALAVALSELHALRKERYDVLKLHHELSDEIVTLEMALAFAS